MARQKKAKAEDTSNDPELELEGEGATPEEFADAALDEGSDSALDEMVDIPEDADLADDMDEEGNIEDEIPLTSKEQTARSLEIRRALEERTEQRKLSEDLDYLDFDLDE